MLNQYFDAGQSALMWYDETWDFLQNEFGEDARLMAGILAVTSPNATVQANVTLALKALRQYKEGEEFHGYLTSVRIALKQLVFDGSVMGGPKIRCFYENLTGNLEPVTVDRWIARALGQKHNPRTIREYESMSLTIAQFARLRGEAPARAQAAIWQGIRHQEQTGFHYGDMKDLLWAKTRQRRLI